VCLLNVLYLLLRVLLPLAAAQAQRFTLQRSMTLQQLAAALGTTVDALVAANPNLGGMASQVRMQSQQSAMNERHVVLVHDDEVLLSCFAGHTQ
jgi:hypothetical protein